MLHLLFYVCHSAGEFGAWALPSWNTEKHYSHAATHMTSGQASYSAAHSDKCMTPEYDFSAEASATGQAKQRSVFPKA